MHLGSKNRQRQCTQQTETTRSRFVSTRGRFQSVCMCLCVCVKGEMPVEAQMVTDGSETNQTGSQDLCPGTRTDLKCLY